MGGESQGKNKFFIYFHEGEGISKNFSSNFLNQIFWTFSFFLIFYFIILKNYLPFYSTALKTRKKVLFFEKKLSNNLIKTQEITSSSLDLLILKNLDEFRLAFIANTTIGKFWTMFPNSK